MVNQLAVRMKVLPSDVGNDRDEMVREIERSLPSGISIRRRSEEPIAFGIVALILDFQIPEEDGVMEKLEEAVRSSGLVGETEVLGISRLSARVGRV